MFYGLISAEEKSRIDADKKLATDLAIEVADRKSAITVEAKSRRADADLVLYGKISTLSGAESTHFAYLGNKIAEVSTRANAAEAALSGRIDLLTVNVDSKKIMDICLKLSIA